MEAHHEMVGYIYFCLGCCCNKDIDSNKESTSFEQALTDLDELVDYLTDRFNTDKVIIVGHSPHYDSPTEFCNALKGMMEEFLK